MKVLYDTSVLIAALLVNHPNHCLALPKLEMAQRHEVHGYVSTHTLAELYSVMTRLPEPLRVSPDEALSAIADLLKYIEAVPLQAKDYEVAISQMAALKLSGGGVFDALIARAAVKANVDCLLTLNPKDFIRLGEAIAALVQVPE